MCFIINILKSIQTVIIDFEEITDIWVYINKEIMKWGNFIYFAFTTAIRMLVSKNFTKRGNIIY